MRRVAGLSVVLLVVFASSAGSTPIDWKRLPYFSYPLGQMLVGTDSSWSNAKAINTGFLKPPQLQSPTGKPMKYDYIWART